MESEERSLIGEKLRYSLPIRRESIRRHRPASGTGGFTLVELAVVLLLVGLLGGVTTLKLNDVAKKSEPQDLADRLAHLQQTARDRAVRRGKPVDLVFDFERQEGRFEPVGESQTQSPRQMVGLGPSWRLTQIFRINHQEQAKQSTPNSVIEIADRGQVPLRIGPKGWMQDCLLIFTGSEGEALAIVFAGLTGTTDMMEGVTDARSLAEALLGVHESD